MRITGLKSLRCLALLLLLALLGGGLLVACDDSEDTSRNDLIGFIDVSAQQTFDLINENMGNSDFIILDIRTLSEYEQAHIQNAVQIDFYSETFRQDLDRLDKNKTYLLYCRSGNRSGQAIPIMQELGFTSVYQLREGFNSWQEAGLPTVDASDMAKVMIYV